MRLTDADKQELIEAACPHCQHGALVRLRFETGEFVHDQVWKKTGLGESLQSGHSICWATGLRTKWAKESQ